MVHSRRRVGGLTRRIMNHKASLTTGSVGGHLFRLTVPMVGGMLAMVSFNLVDAYFVSQLDVGLPEPIHLAAMGYIFPVVMFIAAVAMGLGFGTNSVISRVIGQGDPHRVAKITLHSLILSVAVVAVLSMIGLNLMDPIFRMIGAKGDTLPLIKQYMTIWFFSVIVVVTPMIGNHAIRATGDTVLPAVIMIVSAGVNIVLDPLLIFGLWGFPQMGIAGAAASTAIGRGVSLIVSLYVLYRKGMIEWPFGHRDEPWLSWGEMSDSWKKILFIGIPSAITTTLFPIAMGFITWLVSQYGDPAVAAAAAGSRVESFVMMVLWALSGSSAAFFGQNWGAMRFGRVNRALVFGAGFCFVWGLTCLLALLFLARPIAILYNPDPEVVRIMTRYLWIIAIGLGMRGTSIFAASFYNAINKPITSGGINIVRMFVLYIPLTFLGEMVDGLYGIFWGLTLANVLAGLASIGWMLYTSRQEPEIARV
jgi:putative MATE family efflux protein